MASKHEEMQEPGTLVPPVEGRSAREPLPVRVVSLDTCGSISDDYSHINIDFKRLGHGFKVNSFKPITEKDQVNGKLKIKSMLVKGKSGMGEDVNYLVVVPEKRRQLKVHVKFTKCNSTSARIDSSKILAQRNIETDKQTENLVTPETERTHDISPLIPNVMPSFRTDDFRDTKSVSSKLPSVKTECNYDNVMSLRPRSHEKGTECLEIEKCKETGIADSNMPPKIAKVSGLSVTNNLNLVSCSTDSISATNSLPGKQDFQKRKIAAISTKPTIILSLPSPKDHQQKYNYLENTEVLYNKLNHFVGPPGSEKWKQSMVLLMDKINFIVRKRHYHYVGSRAEGLAYPSSDSDFLDEYPVSMQVTTEDEQDNCLVTCVLEVDETYTCYAKILVKNPTAFSTEIQKVFVQRGNKTYISNSLFKQRLPNRTQIEGPSIVSAYKDSSIDHVHCIACTGWPSSAEEWLNRKRPGNWPTQDQLREIRAKAFHVVACGYPQSPDDFLLWRISFSLAERSLVWSFNHTQLKVYYLLKCVVKEALSKDSGKALRSYFIKMVLFWEIEESILNFWIPENLKICFMSCLYRFRKCVANEWLSHYFIRNFNLFANKIYGEVRDKLLSELNNMCTEGFDCLYRCKSLGVLQRDVRYETKSDEYEKNLDKRIASILPMLATRVTAIRLSQLMEVIEYLEQTTAEGSINYTTRTLIHHLRLYCYRMLALNLASNEISSRYLSNKNCYALQRNILNLLTRGGSYDFCSGKLTLATYFYVSGSYAKALDIATYVLQNFRQYFLYKRQAATYLEDYKGYLQNFCGKKLSISQKASRAFMYDVIFPVHHTNDVPRVLDLERSYTSKCLIGLEIPSMVYAHLLTFLCYNATGHLENRNTAMEGMLKEIRNIRRYPNVPVYQRSSFNVAGYCLLVLGNITEAHRMFTMSLKEDPDDNSAAMYINQLSECKLIPYTGKFITYRYTPKRET